MTLFNEIILIACETNQCSWMLNSQIKSVMDDIMNNEVTEKLKMSHVYQTWIFTEIVRFQKYTDHLHFLIKIFQTVKYVYYISSSHNKTEEHRNLWLLCSLITVKFVNS